MLGIWLGTGIGGGLILGGKLHRGAYFSAGEIGQTVPNPHEPRETRILERQASRAAIAARLADAKGVLHHEMTSDRIAELHETGDPDAIAIVGEATALVGVAVANAITLLSLNRVVVGGGIVERMGDAIVAPIAEAARRDVFPDECRQTAFVPTRLGHNAGLLGASLIARDSLPPA
jgi:glucokinase